MHGNYPYGHEISKPWTSLVQKLTRYARSGCSPTFKGYLKINYLKCIKDPEQVANRKSVFVRTSATGSLNYKPFMREEACFYVKYWRWSCVRSKFPCKCVEKDIELYFQSLCIALQSTEFFVPEMDKNELLTNSCEFKFFEIINFIN